MILADRPVRGREKEDAVGCVLAKGRRSLMTGLAIAAATLVAAVDVGSQAPARLLRIGMVSVRPDEANLREAPTWKALIEGLRDQGFIEGRDYAFDLRFAPGRPERIVYAPRVAQLAREKHVPGMFAFREVTDAGGLMSYGPSIHGMWRQSARLIARVLTGEKAGDIPIEQPTRLELVINQSAAKDLGLKLPQTLVLQADQVVD